MSTATTPDVEYRLKTDRKTKAVYLRIQEEGTEVKQTFEIDKWTLIDLAADGSVVGIELLHNAR